MAGESRGSWNGGQSYRYKEGGSKGTKSWRPLHAPGSEILSVPLWEKKFCTCVGAIPWKRFCENKKFMGMYKNVIQWDDSAALEAFQNAKARFFAEYNGFHCNIPPPDPNLYIDEVDQDAIVDPDLVADLDKPPPASIDVDNTATNGWDSFIFTDKPVPASGWDDTEDPVPSNEKTGEHSSANWDAYIEQIRPSGWGNASETYCSSWDIKNDSGNAWGCSGGVWGKGLVRDKLLVCGTDNYWDNWKRNSWGTWENRNNEPNRRNGRKRDGGGRFGSRYTKPKYQVDGHQSNNSWTDCRGRNRTNHPYQNMVYAEQHLAM
ncbi:uncharacterized protein [Elaeis guineensis]|uniref:Uncharacterized protein LOC105045581 isoform X1 n=1 Tax=Elaeis guineensis var. tenera TaxID=51953 RepID=A0A6J0PIR1_ELAGV|nr:uncharacterized protein LOC105045581 isoform X1 [Elaeis guineensis]XP_010922226.1 uncharacterized protein LOC105045581 isoform X1 [Elaeis guineensis]XP_010922229.1 uncharacterized protein LOC105045581 isoform X1 [Elaeis guineensis]XP_019706536.1 uncharacterized protein LOC105045581 isoform X1 [Elaeis guineensis]